MSIQIGQRVRVRSGPLQGFKGVTIWKGGLGRWYVVRLDNGTAIVFPQRELLPINDASPEEGWIGGTDAEDDEVRERRRG